MNNSASINTFGGKYNNLVRTTKILGREFVPQFFGISDHQVKSIVCRGEIEKAWAELQQKGAECVNYWRTERGVQAILSISEKVDKLVRRSKNVFTEKQIQVISSLKERTIIVRSSSNEDGRITNAGGNVSISSVKAEASSIQQALALVIASYFSVESLGNRGFQENPFEEFPTCSAIVMEQITEDPNDPYPITSGVMITNKTIWSSPGEENLAHISASWGFSSGTSHEVTCDEWILTGGFFYPSIRKKPYRITHSDGKICKTPNNPKIKNRPCLSDNHLKQLQELGTRLESEFKKPLDIEFVIKNDQVLIVQVRPYLADMGSNDYNFLDLSPCATNTDLNVFRGEMIVPGLGRVLDLKRGNILFAKNLKEAEKRFIPGRYKAVVVCVKESSNTHPAINFANQRPIIPCLFLQEKLWKKANECGLSDFDTEVPYQLCTQTATLAMTRKKLSLSQGLFSHPAYFSMSLDENSPIQDDSSHPIIVRLKSLLSVLPKDLLIDELQKELQKIFIELFSRDAITPPLHEAMKHLERACYREVGAIQDAMRSNFSMRAAFHTGILRALIFDSDPVVVGAHSLSGVERYTDLPAAIKEFIISYRDTSNDLCSLALVGHEAFDTVVQKNWLSFLKSIDRLSERPAELLEVIQELKAHGILTHWLSLHFSNEVVFSTKIWEKLLVRFEGSFSPSRLHSLASSFKNICSANDLEIFWENLEELTSEFLNSYPKNPYAILFMPQLIELWDGSTKIVRSSHYYSPEEEVIYFRSRVDAFEKFAVQASEANALQYSLKDLPMRLKTWGNDRHVFSVEHWLIPMSWGAMRKIKTEDQRLTVIHQNMVLASSTDRMECLPEKLRRFCDIFEEKNTILSKRHVNNGGKNISIQSDRAFVRINIPLNYHSTVVTLSQRKGKEEVELTVYFRGSDNDRTMHIKYFRLFSAMSQVPLIDYELDRPNLMVRLSARSEEQMSLLAEAVVSINSESLAMHDDFDCLYRVMRGDQSPLEVMENIGRVLWEKFQETDELIYPSGEAREGALWASKELEIHPNAQGALIYYLKKNNLFDQLINRFTSEIQGKLPISSIHSRYITPQILKVLPREQVMNLCVADILGSKLITPRSIPKEYKRELISLILEKMPEEGIRFLHRFDPIDPLIIQFFEKKMEKPDSTLSQGESVLLIRIFEHKFHERSSERVISSWTQLFRSNLPEALQLIREEKESCWDRDKEANLERLERLLGEADIASASAH